MLRDNGEELQIIRSFVYQLVSASFGAVVSDSRHKDLLFSVTDGVACTGSDEDDFAAGIVTVFTYGVAGGEAAKENFVVGIHIHVSQQLTFAALEVGKVLSRNIFFF